MSNKINYFNLFIEFYKMKKKKNEILKFYEENNINRYILLKNNLLSTASASDFLKIKNIPGFSIIESEPVTIPNILFNPLNANIDFSKEVSWCIKI